MNEHNQKLKFKELPGYAAYILEHCMEEFTGMLVRFSIEEEVPLLRLFSHLSEEDLVRISLPQTTEFLKVLIENRAQEYLDQALKAYVEDRLPEVGREDILAKDITLGTFVRRKAFRKLIPRYTMDFALSSDIMEELDRFVAASEGETFKAFIQVQQEKITRINAELLQQKEELLELQALADMGSFVWNLADDTSVATPGVHKILGDISRIGDFMQRLHPEDRERVRREVQEAMDSNGVFESEYRYISHGVEKYIWSRGFVSFEDGQPLIMKGNVMDVTDKHKLIAGLKESETLSKQSQALTHIGNWSWDVITNEVSWSDEMYRIYGLEPQSEVITFDRFLSLIHPDDRAPRLKQIEETMQTLEARDYMIRVVNPDGIVRMLRGRGEVIVKDGKAVKLVGTCQDITKEHTLNEELHRKTAELEKLNASLGNKNAELERINKELESFNYVASHDLQEPLRKIQIFTGRILEVGKEALPEGTAGYFDKIIASSSRMRLLIDDLLKFSRTGMSEQALAPVDLNLVLMQSIAQETDDKHLHMSIGHLPVIEGIHFQLQQLFSNLFSNSIKYARTNVTPEVRISARIVEEQEIPDHLNASGAYHEITFKDNGIGFSPENAEKIFDLFQRLHGRNEYSGTGIGLAICKKIMYNHKGFITAESKPGKGAIFRIYLPVVAAKLTIERLEDGKIGND